MSEQADITKFGKLRSYFWPIHAHELPRLLPLFVLFFLVAFNYNLLRPFKQSLIVSIGEVGPEMLPFLKVWFVLPCAVALTAMYTRLNNYLSREHVFYAFIGLFLGFFIVFVAVLQPNLEFFALHGFGHWLERWLPEGFRGLIETIVYWPLSLFYTMSELWGAIIMTLLFWGFVNEVTTMEEAKRYYSYFSFSSNISGFLSGFLGAQLSRLGHSKTLALSADPWQQSMILLVMVVVSSSLIILVLFRWMHLSGHVPQRSLAQPPSMTETAPEEKKNAKDEPKQRLSLIESLKYVMRYRYLAYLAITVIAYNIIFNLLDVFTSAKIRENIVDANAIGTYFSIVTGLTGLVSSAIDLFVTGYLLRRCGWTISALITPAVILITGIFFFTTILFEHFHYSDVLWAIFHTPTFQLIVVFGTIQLIATRSCKYTIFDATKEVAYIPLTQVEKRQGKAVVDVIASRLGKSGGSILYQFLLVAFHGIHGSTPVIVTLIMVISVIWMFTTLRLGKQVEARVSGYSRKSA